MDQNNTITATAATTPESNGNPAPAADPIALRRRLAAAPAPAPEASGDAPRSENISARQRMTMNTQARTAQQPAPASSSNPPTISPATAEASTPGAAPETSSDDASSAATGAEPGDTTTGTPAAGAEGDVADTDTSAQAGAEGAETDAGAGEGEQLEHVTAAGNGGMTREEFQQLLADAAAPEGVKKLLKRVHELVDQRDGFRNALLQAQLPAGEGEQPAAPAARPAGPTVQDEALVSLRNDITSVKHALGKVRALDPEIGGSIQLADGTTQELNGNQVRELTNHYSDQLVELNSRASAREILVQQKGEDALKENIARTVQAYPWWGKAETPQHQRAVELAREHPEFMHRPDRNIIIARLVAAEFAERGGKPAAGAAKPLVRPAGTKPPANRTPPQVVTATATVAPRIKPEQASLKNAEDQFRKSGSARDKEKLLAARRAAA